MGTRLWFSHAFPMTLMAEFVSVAGTGKHLATGQANSTVPVRSLTSPGDQLTAAITNATVGTF